MQEELFLQKRKYRNELVIQIFRKKLDAVLKKIDGILFPKHLKNRFVISCQRQMQYIQQQIDAACYSTERFIHEIFSQPTFINELNKYTRRAKIMVDFAVHTIFSMTSNSIKHIRRYIKSKTKRSYINLYVNVNIQRDFEYDPDQGKS